MRSSSRSLVLIVFAMVALVCARLGVWQLHRLRERRAANRTALAERSQPPLDLRLDRTALKAPPDRRVRLSGHYDNARVVILRGRAYQGVPGVEIVTPLVGSSEKIAVLVNRGFVPAPDAATISPGAYDVSDRVNLEGIAYPISSGGGKPIAHGGDTTWARLDWELLRGEFPYQIAPFYVLQTSASPSRFPRPLDPPPLDDGPHLSYAIQWFAFAVLAIIFGIVIARQSSRHPAARSSW